LAKQEVQIMETTMAARIRALREMTAPELAAKYREVFGEETRSRNKDFLRKRIAWRMQALEEGDISERVRRRAAELAKDSDIRVRPPRDAFADDAAPAAERTHVAAFGRRHDVRLPMPGTVLTREYRGRVLRATVLADGFEFEGRVYRSLSAIATEVTGSRWNGFLFFGLTERRPAGSDR
jgi:hypothetical protein